MDFFPDLGEPGIFDELFYFGPVVFVVMLGVFIFRLLGRRMKGDGLGVRIVSTAGLLFILTILFFIVFGLVFRLANPTLI